ncbi:MAG: TraB/GumN family protein [SAR86 cluster bacterium]|uniref:TraB/GumN family protein n=1 Tax=SAR86 cluster bacterium TaxID=2030880 RepID=A0A2A4MUD9_9GAMM|nr:MAG: TraB/GumN family protein [SAR86 cluster bacterium]
MHLFLGLKQKPIASQTLLLLLIMLFFTLHSSAESSVWQVSSQGNSVFLGGTVHLLRPSDYPLPEEYEQAYRQSEQLYFETDINSMSSLQVQAKMMQQLTYSDGRSLKTILSEEAYSALDSYTEKVGLPLLMLEKFKPGLLVSTLQIIEFQKMGFTPQGVDAYFNTRAMGDGKALGALEPVEAQIDYIAKMGEGKESEFILLSLQEMDELETMMEQMISAWRTGDSALLAELFVDEMRLETPDLYQSLLVERNNNWMPIIEAMFDDEDTEFVLVGAAHMVGEDGLLAQLESRGYEVRQL